ncbi:arabinosyltransferase C-terminal domain-containing protein [Nocardia cyriacigeorgica]|uniref:arabinosyltransferase C-terminal domain-containing protein n=1 Tax=Nocardia cyriacigeorgica TaxID=135487 RepID=UPI0024563C22|nr:arabinosyltransferase C-terminal domain-containing protein [Nocardia cyriacigeorgica]
MSSAAVTTGQPRPEWLAHCRDLNAKAAVSQYPAYSLAKSNISATFSDGSGLADDVEATAEGPPAVGPPGAGGGGGCEAPLARAPIPQHPAIGLFFG